MEYKFPIEDDEFRRILRSTSISWLNFVSHCLQVGQEDTWKEDFCRNLIHLKNNLNCLENCVKRFEFEEKPMSLLDRIVNYCENLKI